MEMIVRDPQGLLQQQGLEGLYPRFLAYLDVKPRTAETYSKAIRRFFSFLQAEGINRPTRETMLIYRDALKQELKPSTTQTYIASVKQFFKWTAQEGLYPDISENVKGAKLDKSHKKDALTSAQAKIILSRIDRDSLTGKRD